MSVGLHYYLAVAGLLFALGLAGMILQRDLRVIYAGIGLTLAAPALLFAAFAYLNNDSGGVVFVLLILAVGAAEIAVGLALLRALSRKRESSKVDEHKTLKR